MIAVKRPRVFVTEALVLVGSSREAAAVTKMFRDFGLARGGQGDDGTGVWSAKAGKYRRWVGLTDVEPRFEATALNQITLGRPKTKRLKVGKKEAQERWNG